MGRRRPTLAGGGGRCGARGGGDGMRGATGEGGETRDGAWADAARRGRRACAGGWARGGIGIRGGAWANPRTSQRASTGAVAGDPRWGPSQGTLTRAARGRRTARCGRREWALAQVRSVRDGLLATGLGAGLARAVGADEVHEAVSQPTEARAGGSRWKAVRVLRPLLALRVLERSPPAVPRASSLLLGAPAPPAGRAPRGGQRPAGAARRRAHPGLEDVWWGVPARSPSQDAAAVLRRSLRSAFSRAFSTDSGAHRRIVQRPRRETRKRPFN